MNPDELFQLADDEIRLGIADPDLMRGAVAGANGVEAVAIQEYWRTRAAQIRAKVAFMGEVEGAKYVLSLQERVDWAKRQGHRRNRLVAIVWVTIFVLSVTGDFAFYALALQTARANDPWFWIYCGLGAVSLIGTGASAIECWRLGSADR